MTNIPDLLVKKCMLPTEQMRVKLDAAWSLCNVFSQGTDQHADFILGRNAVAAIVQVLNDNMVGVNGMTSKCAYLFWCDSTCSLLSPL